MSPSSSSGQLWDDIKEACVLAADYIPAALAAHAVKGIESALEALAQMLLAAAVVMAVSTAVGAAIGALAGGAGAAPGAAAGFEVGMALLQWMGLAFIIKWVAGALLEVGSEFGAFLGSVWDAHGDEAVLDGAAHHLAETLGLFLEKVIEGLVMLVAAKGLGAAMEGLSGTRFGEAMGESRFGEWLSERAANVRDGRGPLKTPRNLLDEFLGRRGEGEGQEGDGGNEGEGHEGEGQGHEGEGQGHEGEGQGHEGDDLSRQQLETPHGGSVEVVIDGEVVVPTGKVEAYPRGKVKPFTESDAAELRELKQRRQTARKEFDKDPGNAKRIKELEKLKHNYERSIEMSHTLDNAGLPDTPENNAALIRHLLEVGRQITPENRVRFPSELNAPGGQLKILSTWTILPDGRVYLSTIQLIPRGTK